MGIPVFSEIANIEFQNSSLLTKEHVSLIAGKETTYGTQKTSRRKSNEIDRSIINRN